MFTFSYHHRVSVEAGAKLNIAMKASADVELVSEASLAISLNAAIQGNAKLKDFVDVSQVVSVEGMF